MASLHVPKITSPEPYVVIAEMHVAPGQSHMQVRLYQRRTAQKPRNYTMWQSATGPKYESVQDATSALLSLLAFYVRMMPKER